MSINFVLNVVSSFFVSKFSISSVIFTFTSKYSDHLSSDKAYRLNLMLGLLSLISLWSGWISSDGGVDLLVELLIRFGFVVVKAFGPESEFFGILFSIFLLNTVGPCFNV